MPWKENPGISIGVSTDGSKGMGLTVTPPTWDFTSRYTQGRQDGNRMVQGASAGPTEGNNLPGNPLVLSAEFEQLRTQNPPVGKFQDREGMRKCPTG